jgi:hypothetical protein
MLRTAIGVVLVILIGYGFIEAYPLLSGPFLSVNPVTAEGTTTDGVVGVSGTTKRAVSLTLDGAPLLMDESGNFATTLTLPKGTSLLTLSAADRFGHTISKQVPVYTP